MGRYNFAAQRVHHNASLVLEAGYNAIGRKKPFPNSNPPAWYKVVGTNPPSEILVRPPMQRPHQAGKKASKLFQPVRITYEEDRLRWDYFNDHPWELARPRIVLENDGRDGERWDWSVPLDHGLIQPRAGAKDKFGKDLSEEWLRIRRTQCKRPINGEAVVQRQAHLIRTGMSRAAAYDQARKEYYRVRHFRETELRVAREEALSTGAYFTIGPLEKGMMLEDQQYKKWKVWAGQQIGEQRARQGAAFTPDEADDGAADSAADVDEDAEPEKDVEAASPEAASGSNG